MLSLTLVSILLTPFTCVHAADEKSKIPVVLVNTVKRSDLFELLSYPARVTPKINANILAESDGIVTRIHAPLGAKVTRGQRLLTLKHTDPVYQYAPVSITAPVSGVVSLVEVTEGTLVTKGNRVATVTDPTQVRITVEIAASDLALVTSGLNGEIKFANTPTGVAVRVHGVSPFVDTATGTATCELELVDPKTTLSPGLVGQVHFRVNLHQGFSLPEHAVVYKGTETFIRVVDGGRAKYILVTLGKKSRGNVEVAHGLSENVQVIERANGFISDGETVTVQGKTL